MNQTCVYSFASSTSDVSIRNERNNKEKKINNPKNIEESSSAEDM